MLAYHFTRDKLRDGRPVPPVGEWLEHEGEIDPCVCGLHASEHPFDALRYSPGNMLHRVALEGDLQPHGDPPDKWAGRRRRILATIDAEPLLREFARWCAIQVIDLWAAPPIVREYLETGDECRREAAREAAREAGAAGEAAWAAWAAAWAAAWEAAWAEQRAKFREMVEAAFAEKGGK